MKSIINLADCLVPNEKGKEVFSKEALKEAIVSSGLVCTDGSFLYIKQSGRYYQRLADKVAIRLKCFLLDKSIEEKITQKAFRQIIEDLLNDSRIYINLNEFDNAEVINFQNGILDLNTGAFLSSDREMEKYRFTYQINADYIRLESGDVNKMPNFINFLEQAIGSTLTDKKAIFLGENIGYLLSATKNLRKAVLLLGETATGKSTLANFLGMLVKPDDMVSRVNFQNLSSRFYLHNVAYAKLNIGDEMNRGRVSNLSVFKSITANECVLVEKKGKDPIFIKPNVKQVYCSNHLPEFDDGNSLAVFDRLNIISFNKTVKEENRDPDLLSKLLGERNTIVSWAIGLFREVYKKRTFTVPEDITRIMEQYRSNIDSIGQFIQEALEDDTESKGISSTELYKKYTQYCISNALSIDKRSHFINQILSTFKKVELKKIRFGDGRNLRGFSHLKYKEKEE